MAILIWRIAAFFISVTHAFDPWDYELSSTKGLAHISELKNLGVFGDADKRGPKWYDDTSETELSTSDMDSKITGRESSLSASNTISDTSSSDASSAETLEKRRATRVYRECYPCPRDLMKAHKNIGIKWICGGYQRARRSFKSECMMRYRNCQDGTMFLKLYDHRCKNDSYHGKHWFYVYKV